MTGRLAGLMPAELNEEQREVYRAVTCGPRAAGPQAFALTDGEGRLRGPFNAMLLSPPVGLAVQALGARGAPRLAGLRARHTPARWALAHPPA